MSEGVYSKRRTNAPTKPPTPPSRIQLPSAFGMILERLVLSVPGAIGASLADEEGETVDFFSFVDPEEVKLATAYMGILLRRTAATRTALSNGGLRELRLLGREAQFMTRPMGHGYYVTVILERFATLPKLHDSLDQAMAELRLESGGVLD